MAVVGTLGELLAVAAVLVGAGVVLCSSLVRRRRVTPVRIAVLGSPSATEALGRELDAARTPRYELAGRIGARASGAGDDYWLGEMRDLRRLLASHRIDLLLLANGTPRM